MSDETPRPSNNIVDEAFGKALGRLLNGPRLEASAAELDLTMERAFMCADPEARPIIIGQVNVLNVVTEWVTLLDTDPDATIPVADAISAVLLAIEAGLLESTL